MSFQEMMREYINQSTKIVWLECHQRFNYECLNNNVVPRSLYCKTLVDTPYGRKLARDFSRNCLKARIQDNKQQIHQTGLRLLSLLKVWCRKPVFQGRRPDHTGPLKGAVIEAVMKKTDAATSFEVEIRRLPRLTASGAAVRPTVCELHRSRLEPSQEWIDKRRSGAHCGPASRNSSTTSP
ncbi:hypothetical protein MTO96_037092 [Rhipicephalus appendiculatus]